VGGVAGDLKEYIPIKPLKKQEIFTRKVRKFKFFVKVGGQLLLKQLFY
jgi:hypothetical protein